MDFSRDLFEKYNHKEKKRISKKDFALIVAVLIGTAILVLLTALGITSITLTIFDLI
jgi:hypothetical protein